MANLVPDGTVADRRPSNNHGGSQCRSGRYGTEELPCPVGCPPLCTHDNHHRREGK